MSKRLVALLGMVLSGAVTVGPSAQTPPADPASSLRVHADSLVAREAWPEAAEALEQLVGIEPYDGEAWYALGRVRYRLRLFEPSALAYERAAGLKFQSARAFYNAACSRALAGMPDAAQANMEQALREGFANKYALLTDPDLDSIREERKWQTLIARFFGTGQYPELSQPVHRIANTGVTRVPMRDGVRLATEVILPRGPGPFPAVLARTPYGRGWQAFHLAHWAARGYALVFQDVRGRGDSEGAFEPWLHERKDGYDTIAWLLNQPWSNGRVGMIGASYAAQVQWLAAAEHPPGLVAIIPLVSGTDPFEDTPYDHGILKLGLLEWSHAVTHPGHTAAGTGPDAWRTLPLSRTDDAVFGEDIPIWNDWVRRNDPASWADAAFLTDVTHTDVAVLHVSGLWDVESIGTATNWAALREAGHRNQWLVFGPWGHQNFADTMVTDRGDVEYGPEARLNLMALWVRFFDTWLKDREVGWRDEPTARVFVTGANHWLRLDGFPPPSGRLLELCLGDSDPGLGATLSACSGVPPATVRYTYDPANVPRQPDPSFAESSAYEAGDGAGDEVRFLGAPLGAAVTSATRRRSTSDLHGRSRHGFLRSAPGYRSRRCRPRRGSSREDAGAVSCRRRWSTPFRSGVFHADTDVSSRAPLRARPSGRHCHPE